MTNLKPQSPYQVLVIGAHTSGELIKVLQSYPGIGKIYIAIHSYQVEAILNSESIAMIFISVRDWQIRFFGLLIGNNRAIANKRIPNLVIIKGRLDQFDRTQMHDHDLIIKEPFTGVQLRNLCAAIEWELCDEKTFDFIWLVIERKWRHISCNDILLAKRHSQNQLRLCTREKDWIVNSSLAALLEKLPEDRFIRISDQLVIPAKRKALITEKGYPFRKEWLPIVQKYRQIQYQVSDIHKSSSM